MLVENIDLNHIDYNYTIEFNNIINYNIIQEKSQEIFYISSTPLEPEWELYLRDLCEELDIYFPRIIALIDLETGETFKNDIVGYNKTTYDTGLMQLNNRWGVPWAEEILAKKIDATVPLENIEGGIAIYFTIREHFKFLGYTGQELTNMSLMAYNRGINGAKSYMQKYGKYNAYVEVICKKTREWEQKIGVLKDPVIVINF